ncbi:hypothetical protein HPB47_011411, partial [Ixodes persulcatus]
GIMCYPKELQWNSLFTGSTEIPKYFQTPRCLTQIVFCQRTALLVILSHSYRFLRVQETASRFGSMEVKITIAHIFKIFNVKPFDQRDKLLLSSELVLRSVDGLRLKFAQREV